MRYKLGDQNLFFSPLEALARKSEKCQSKYLAYRDVLGSRPGNCKYFFLTWDSSETFSRWREFSIFSDSEKVLKIIIIKLI